MLYALTYSYMLYGMFKWQFISKPSIGYQMHPTDVLYIT